MKPDVLCPECRAGKCRACNGEAWDPETDTIIECAHECHLIE